MPELFDDLRRLGALKNARLGGEPSNRTLARKAGLAPETPGKWFGGGRLPRDAAALRTVVQEIRVEAERRGVLNEPVEGGSTETLARFLDPRRWEAALEAERRSRADGARVAAEREQARRALAAQETRERQAALPDRPRPVRSWTARRLGVHPAISGGPAGTAADFVLPRYVTRPHDTALRRHLRTVVAADRTTLVLLQGGSCTGKTRTAVEALHQAVPDDFELLFPADTAGLLAALAADALPPRGVLWLDEAQEYLAGPEGEAAAAALLRRLDGAGPLIVLATLWPDDEARLVAPAEARGARDPRRHTRDLLHQATPCLLPGTFAEDLEAVREAARQDPSLAEALRTGTGDITQILAAGPDLVKRYERPTGTHGVYAGALISGAMDACRLGLAGPLPTAFLADAAYGYLPAEAQVAVSGDGDWLSGALDHARVRVRDVVAALQEVPRADGRGAVPGVLRLADYLEQHGGRTRERLCPPATFWESAAAHLADRWDLPRLASAAEARLRYRHAARLYAVAAGGAAGAAALVGLGTLQERCDDPRAARSTYRRAVEAGDGEAAARLARLAEQSGDRAEAERLVRLVGATASYRVYEVLLRLFEARLRNEEFAEAERFARELAVEGDEGYALSVLAHRFGSAGDRAESTRLLRAAADARNSAAMVSLALRCEEEGEQEEAERLLLAAAERGNQSAMTSLAIRREESGDREEAERYARRAGESGIGGALVGLAMRRDRRGETAEAERLALLAHRAGDREALTDLATRRLRAGDREGAERVCRTAADEGVGQGMAMLALLRDDAGDTGEAIEWARRADAEHFPYGFQWLIERWCAAGRDDEAGRLVAEARLWSTAVLTWERRGQGEQAEALARQAAAEGDWWPLTFLARLRSHDGRTEDAERLYRAAVDAGDVSALRGVAELRAGRGDRETARRLVRRAGALVRPHELIPLAELAAKISDRAGAERLYLAAAGAGTHGALAGLCGLRGEADRRRLRRCGLDGDGRLEQEEFDWPPLGPDCRET